MLLFTQQIIPRAQLPILCLPRNTGNHINRCICLHRCRQISRGKIKLMAGICVKQRIVISGCCLLPDILPDHFTPLFSRILIICPISLNPVLIYNFETGIFQPFIDTDCLPHIDISGAGASFDRRHGSRSIKCQLRSLRKGKQSILIFQKNHSVCGGPSRHRPVCRLVCALLRLFCSGKRKFFDLSVHSFTLLLIHFLFQNC